MKRQVRIIPVLAAMFLLSGCGVAMQEDVGRVQEKAVQVETRFSSLESDIKESRKVFEDDWNQKIAAISEDLNGIREKIASGEGALSVLAEQIRQETDRAEKFRASATQDLTDFQRGVGLRLDLFQSELDVLKKSSAVTALEIKKISDRVDKAEQAQSLLSDRVAGVDTALSGIRNESDRKMAVIIEEVSKENADLRARIAKLEKPGPVVKSVKSAPARKKK